jgi:hypothetical protein
MLGPSMFIAKKDRNNTHSFSAMLFCTVVIVSTIGNSFGIRNSYAQQELQTQQPSTLSESPWSNDLPTFDTGLQHHNAVISSSQTFTNSKQLDLRHSFVSNKVVGPDRFRFITSYWTSSDTFRGIDTGTSANNTFLAANSLPPNVQQEVDTNEGPQTLAIVLQYQGVVDLAGVTAALKLPAGFNAQLPLTSDKNDFSIALSNYRGHIFPSQGIVLYFDVDVLPTAIVQLPVLGPMALHFLRSDQRSILDSLNTSQQNVFAKVLSVTNTTFSNSTSFNHNFDFKRDYFNQFGRFIPYDFINQVIPVIFKVTGAETLDVVTLPTAGKDAVKNISTQIVTIPNGVTTLVRLAVRNTGDVPVWDLGASVTTGLQSALGINGLNPAAITSTNVPQTLFSTILPLGIVGASNGLISMAKLPANSNEEIDVRLFPSHYVAGTVELLNIDLTWNNVIGERAEQENQVYFLLTPSP